MFIFAKHPYKKSAIKIFLPVWKGGILTIWFTCVRDQNFTV